MGAYKQKTEAEAKLWREKANVSAWLQGAYIARAIGACFSKRESYSEKPLHMFADDGSEGEEDTSSRREQEQGKQTQDLITAQMIRVKSILEKQQNQ